MNFRKITIFFLLGVMIFLTGCSKIFQDNKENAKSTYNINYKIGDKVDEYKGVNVYFNGKDYVKSQGLSYSSDGYYYGYKWQCVEFVKRFYYDVYKHKMPEAYGNAKDFFDKNLPQGGINTKRDMIQYINGENEKPKADDLLVFNDTKFGHVAVICKVNASSVDVIQQNVYGKSRVTYSLKKTGDNYVIGSRRKPAGFLRIKK